MTDEYLKATFTSRTNILARHVTEVFPSNPTNPLSSGAHHLLISLNRVLQTRQSDTMAVQRYDIPANAVAGTDFVERYWSPVNSPLLNKNGQVIYIVHRAEDVTDYILAKQGNSHLTIAERQSIMEREIFVRAQQIQMVNEELRRSEERFRLIIESVKDYAIFMLDPRGFVTSWNAGAKRIQGYSETEIIGKHFSTFFSPHDIAAGKCERELKQAEQFGRHEEESWRLRKGGEKFWASTIVTALWDENGVLQGFSKVTRDITEKKNAEDKLHLAYETLEKRVEERTQDLAKTNETLQDALQSTDEFFSIASHELKTPITVLKMQIQLLHKKIEKKDANVPVSTLVPKIKIINQQINKLTALVNNLLDVSRIKNKKLNIEPALINLSSLIQDILNQISDQTTELGIQLTTNIQENVTGLFDKLRIEQMLMNLLSNAIKYGKNNPINVTLKADGSQTQLLIHDRGIGISKADQDRIFGRFERAVSERDYNGMGLGLYITKQIVESHGGNIRLESILEQGTTFTIVFPCHNVSLPKEETTLG